MSKLFAVLLLFSGLSASAQYAKIREPQDPKEIKLFQSLGVLGQLEKIDDHGKLMTVRARAFDSSGRVIGDLTATSRKYYQYNRLGKVTAYRDTTILKDNSVKKEDFLFAYKEDFPVILEEAIFPYGSSKFTYDGKNNFVFESGRYNDTLWTSYYYYTPEYQPRLVYHYANNKLFHTEKSEYGPGGVLFHQISVDHYEDGSDSADIVYQYNSKQQLIKKAVFRYSKVITNDDNGKPSVQADQFISETIDYKYNDKGQLASEEYNHSINKFAHQFITYEYDKKGLKVKAKVQGLGEPTVYVYEYGFFGQN
jgi:hypothetical protein